MIAHLIEKIKQDKYKIACEFDLYDYYTFITFDKYIIMFSYDQDGSLIGYIQCNYYINHIEYRLIIRPDEIGIGFEIGRGIIWINESGINIIDNVEAIKIKIEN